MKESLTSKFKSWKDKISFEVANEPCFQEARDKIIGRFFKNSEARGIMLFQKTPEEQNEFVGSVLREIRDFSNEIESGYSLAKKKIIKAKCMDLIFKSINEGIDSLDMFKRIISELQFSIGPMDSKDLAEIKSFILEYYKHRKKSLEIYKKFLFNKTLLASFIGLRTSIKHNSVDLSPLGLEINTNDPNFITSENIGLALGLYESKHDGFKNPGGLLNIIYYRYKGDKQTLIHERSHCIDYLVEESLGEKDPKSRESILERFNYEIKTLKRLIKYKKPGQEVLLHYERALTAIYQSMDINFNSEIVAYGMGDIQMKRIQNDPRQRFGNLPKGLKPFFAKEPKPKTSQANPSRIIDDSQANSKYESSFMADYRYIFNQKIYDYVNDQYFIDNFFKPLDDIMSNNPYFVDKAEKIKKDFKDRRIELIKQIQISIEIFIRYFPEHKDTLFSYLRDLKDPNNTVLYIQRFLFSLKDKRKSFMCNGEILDGIKKNAPTPTDIRTNKPRLEHTYISRNNGNLFIFSSN